MATSDLACTSRGDRILVEKLRLLYRGHFAVPVNLVVAAFVVYMMRTTFPHPLLGAWFAAMTVVIALRIALYQYFLRAKARGPCGPCWARRFCIGAALSGMLWGSLCFGLPAWGTPDQFVLMTLVVTGISAGALVTIVTYLPAFFSFVVPMISSLAICLLSHPNPQIAVSGWLVFIYLLVISGAANILARTAIVGIELQIDNEILAASLSQTRIERDAARTEKWSTLAHLSHELRTPLNAILGFSEAMREEMFGPLGDKRYKDYAGHMHSSGRHLLLLVQEILELSEGEAGALRLDEQDVDVTAVMRDCVGAFIPEARKAGVSLSLAIPPEPPRLRGDPRKIRQMLHNLVDNAIKFTPARGTVTVALTENAGVVALSVRDTGIGMRAEDIPIALQPFGRIASPLKHGTDGAGLGLPITQRLAELHGATLAVVSEAGRGTTCTITFPAPRTIGPLQETPAAVA